MVRHKRHGCPEKRSCITSALAVVQRKDIQKRRQCSWSLALNATCTIIISCETVIFPFSEMSCGRARRCPR